MLQRGPGAQQVRVPLEAGGDTGEPPVMQLVTLVQGELEVVAVRLRGGDVLRPGSGPSRAGTRRRPRRAGPGRRQLWSFAVVLHGVASTRRPPWHPRPRSVARPPPSASFWAPGLGEVASPASPRARALVETPRRGPGLLDLAQNLSMAVSGCLWSRSSFWDRRSPLPRTVRSFTACPGLFPAVPGQAGPVTWSAGRARDAQGGTGVGMCASSLRRMTSAHQDGPSSMWRSRTPSRIAQGTERDRLQPGQLHRRVPDHRPGQTCAARGAEMPGSRARSAALSAASRPIASPRSEQRICRSTKGPSRPGRAPHSRRSCWKVREVATAVRGPSQRIRAATSRS